MVAPPAQPPPAAAGRLVQTLNVSLMLSVGLELDPLVLARALDLPPAVMAGMMLAAAAPGGTGTLLTRLARGSLELSVA